MEAINSQSVTKAVSSEVPSVAIKPAGNTVSGVKPVADLSGNELPQSKNLSELSNKAGAGVEGAVSRLNDFVQHTQRGIQFSVHEETGRSVVIITDKETGEEIRKFPSDEALSIAEHISETLAVPGEQGVGFLVNGKA